MSPLAEIRTHDAFAVQDNYRRLNILGYQAFVTMEELTGGLCLQF